MADLKPCPFCGGAAHFDHDDNGWNWIECSQCGVSTKAAVHAGEDCHPILAEQWNRRHTPAGVPPDRGARPLTASELSDCCGGCRTNSAIETWMRRAIERFCAVNGIAITAGVAPVPNHQQEQPR